MLYFCNLTYGLLCACVLKFILMYTDYYDEVQLVHFVILKMKVKLKFRLKVTVTEC